MKSPAWKDENFVLDCTCTFLELDNCTCRQLHLVDIVNHWYVFLISKIFWVVLVVEAK